MTLKAAHGASEGPGAPALLGAGHTVEAELLGPSGLRQRRRTPSKGAAAGPPLAFSLPLSTRGCACGDALQQRAELAATELRFFVTAQLWDCAGEVVVARGSLTLTGLAPDGLPRAANVPLVHWCGAGAGTPAGTLQVQLRLRLLGRRSPAKLSRHPIGSLASPASGVGSSSSSTSSMRSAAGDGPPSRGSSNGSCAGPGSSCTGGCGSAVHSRS